MAFAKPNSKSHCRQGNINVNTENIFPIIKKFLYTDQDIFLQIVSNAVDATRKLDMLIRKGGWVDFTPQITIRLDKEAKTTISDDGLGMDEEEIIKYLRHCLFKAEEFAESSKI